MKLVKATAMWKYIRRLWRGKYDDACISEQSLKAIAIADARKPYEGPSWKWPVRISKSGEPADRNKGAT